ncbi:hypothetical protein CAOG_04029 [Capsaspora owczarzaki ATCC 30864]|uniref:Uncharacterized protein n=1 Tax=Capsaspora owczarzaki (strain ATCC 30864) TaxID=595528 RepID=A0A0D2WQJ3_CAPO3|nr:hypothetical protein CAOG_04029 [Capsaspora owczarzaki ATCC 30864]KJE93208.1 hypothetical protein CAOG_004029 [Capsaspora owczarzaki ATCC 30864]|eukprot:XP_004347854.2 hypothetical protein CAOG_04029 [Capsaspora owczarzaki ATCC 30864]
MSSPPSRLPPSLAPVAREALEHAHHSSGLHAASHHPTARDRPAPASAAEPVTKHSSSPAASLSRAVVESQHALHHQQQQQHTPSSSSQNQTPARTEARRPSQSHEVMTHLAHPANAASSGPNPHRSGSLAPPQSKSTHASSWAARKDEPNEPSAERVAVSKSAMAVMESFNRFLADAKPPSPSPSSSPLSHSLRAGGSRSSTASVQRPLQQGPFSRGKDQGYPPGYQIELASRLDFAQRHADQIKTFKKLSYVVSSVLPPPARASLPGQRAQHNPDAKMDFRLAPCPTCTQPTAIHDFYCPSCVKERIAVLESRTETVRREVDGMLDQIDEHSEALLRRWNNRQATRLQRARNEMLLKQKAWLEAQVKDTKGKCLRLQKSTQQKRAMLAAARARFAALQADTSPCNRQSYCFSTVQELLMAVQRHPKPEAARQKRLDLLAHLQNEARTKLQKLVNDRMLLFPVFPTSEIHCSIQKVELPNDGVYRNLPPEELGGALSFVLDAIRFCAFELDTPLPAYFKPLPTTPDGHRMVHIERRYSISCETTWSRSQDLEKLDLINRQIAILCFAQGIRVTDDALRRTLPNLIRLLSSLARAEPSRWDQIKFSHDPPTPRENEVNHDDQENEWEHIDRRETYFDQAMTKEDVDNMDEWTITNLRDDDADGLAV